MEIAVCDDDILFLDEMRDQLVSLPMVDNIFMFSDLDAFLFSIDGGKRYDAVLMDIEWNNKVAGMDSAAELFRLSPDAKIIYVTGHVERYSQEIFLHRANLSGYLTKPVDAELLRANMQKIADALPLCEQPSLVLKQHGAAVSIPLREIFYIESEAHTIHVHTAEDKATAYEQLDNIQRTLPGNFFRCHKSYIVNMSQIRRIQSGYILLKNGGLVPVSRARYAGMREAYFNYMGQKI